MIETAEEMFAPSNAEVQRVKYGSQVSSSSSSIITIRPVDTADSSLEARHGTLAHTVTSVDGGYDIQRPLNFSETSPPSRHMPSHILAQDIKTSEGLQGNGQTMQSRSVPFNAPSAGAKRHISFSKRFSFSSGPIEAYGNNENISQAGNVPNLEHGTGNQSSAEDIDLRRAEASLRSNWTTLNSGSTQSTSSIAGTPRTVLNTPDTSAESRYGLSGHDPFDYRGSFARKEEEAGHHPAHRADTNINNLQEMSEIRRASSRRKRQGLSGQIMDRTHIKITNEEDIPRNNSQAAMAQDIPRTASSSTSGKSSGHKDKKSMLSRALHRANAAVTMDNAQDYAGAKEAYEEACDYLTRVMSRSSNEEDKRRLVGIRSTYTARIEELQHLGSRISMRSDQSSGSASKVSSLHASFDGASDDHTLSPSPQTSIKIKLVGKELLRGPDSEISKDQFAYSSMEPNVSDPESNAPHLPTRRFDNPSGSDRSSTTAAQLTPNGLFTSLVSHGSTNGDRSKADTLSSPTHLWKVSSTQSQNLVQPVVDSTLDRRPSQASSNHSLTSVNGLRRKYIHMASGTTEAEFDAALDAAVEAVYDDGYELYNNVDAHVRPSYNFSAMSQNRPFHNYNTFAEREASIAIARTHSAAQTSHRSHESLSELESETETDEEERLLEKVTRDFLKNSQLENDQAKAGLPRQSNSSGSSGHTWASSNASSISTIVTPLSPVTENVPVPSAFGKSQARHLPPPTPPPTSALPRLPPNASLPSLNIHQHPGLQDRRSAGQRVKRLQIKTAGSARSSPRPSGSADLASHSDFTQTGPLPSSTTPDSSMRYDLEVYEVAHAGHAGHMDNRGRDPLSPNQLFQGGMLSSSSPSFSPFVTEVSTAASPDHKSGANLDSASPGDSLNRSDSQRPLFPRNLSSTSLMDKIRSGGQADNIDATPDTPLSFGFTPLSPPTRKTPYPAAPVQGSSPPPAPYINKVQLFTNEMHMPSSPSSPGSRILHPPRPLEPCPESSLLRPFWLLRCVYQTISHPRGGYVTTRLFIPREVWKTKNMKLRAVEDKVAACDLLTAALLKLGGVNSLDADAIHEEFQNLEAVMDQVQANLMKKLGNDVGVHHISSLFKDAPPLVSGVSSDKSDAPTQSFHSDVTANAPSTGSFGKASGKSSFNLSSWRKLRTKNSSNSLSTSFSSIKDAPKETLTMPSLPMAGSGAEETVFKGNRRSMVARPVVGAADAMKMEGPNSNYMAALARLCEAVQILDQIARQVEDPGLKLSSPTHVGLELSARHASEFFGFYVCRFVLQDVTLLAEKFVKRASEWVML